LVPPKSPLDSPPFCECRIKLQLKVRVNNFKTAKPLGLTIPFSLLGCPDEVIEQPSRLPRGARVRNWAPFGHATAARQCLFTGADRKWPISGKNYAIDPGCVKTPERPCALRQLTYLVGVAEAGNMKLVGRIGAAVQPTPTCLIAILCRCSDFFESIPGGRSFFYDLATYIAVVASAADYAFGSNPPYGLPATKQPDGQNFA
jgi:hypothetical protein